MHLAYISVPGRGRIDNCMAEIVARLQGRGLRVTGTVRAGAPENLAHPCDMDLRVLPDGPGFRISQPLGAGARGCRLDGSEIERVASEVEARLDGADVLVVNKYGKQETIGRGLRPAMIHAIETGIPVLVGVNAFNLPDFLQFAAGNGTALAPDPDEALKWLDHWLCVAPLVAE